MSQKELNQVNKVYHAIVIIAAIAMAITAIIYNPGHLFTAGLIYAFGINSEFKSKDAYKFDLRY